MWKLLEVEPGSRFSALERLRTAPARVSGPEMVRALGRAAEVAQVGAGDVDVSGVPATRLVALARYGVTAKATALRDLAESRRTATVVLPAGLHEHEMAALRGDHLAGSMVTSPSGVRRAAAE